MYGGGGVVGWSGHCGGREGGMGECRSTMVVRYDVGLGNVSSSFAECRPEDLSAPE